MKLIKNDKGHIQWKQMLAKRTDELYQRYTKDHDPEIVTTDVVEVDDAATITTSFSGKTVQEIIDILSTLPVDARLLKGDRNHYKFFNVREKTNEELYKQAENQAKCELQVLKDEINWQRRQDADERRELKRLTKKHGFVDV